MNERQQKIIEILRQKKKSTIDTLCQTLSYSRSTIRRDIISLEQIGIIKKEKGSIHLLTTTSKEKHFKLRSLENIEKKQQIARLTIDFITDGMSIFLDASSTTFQLCTLLTHYTNLSVVTNGIEIAHYLINHSSIEVFMVGGYIRDGSSSVVGEPAIDYINQFNLDLCIVSCTGLIPKGCYEPSLQQAMTKRAMMANANLVLMLCDSSKFENTYKFKLSAFDSLDYLITDCKPNPSLCEAMTHASCEVIYPA